MGISKPVFTCMKTKTVDNFQRRMNKKSFFFLYQHAFLQIYNKNKIKRNNTEDTTKACPYFSFLEK